MASRINKELKDKITRTFNALPKGMPWKEKLILSFREHGYPLIPTRMYASCWPWLPCETAYKHVKLDGSPVVVGQRRGMTGDSFQSPSIESAIDQLVTAIADRVSLSVWPKIEERLAQCIVSATAKRPEPIVKQLEAKLTTREKLVAELKIAKSTNDRFTIIRCVDKLKQLDLRDKETIEEG